MPMIAAIVNPISRPYSKMAQPHWNRAESLIPSAATTSTIRLKAVPTRATSYLLLAAALLKKLSM